MNENYEFHGLRGLFHITVRTVLPLGAAALRPEGEILPITPKINRFAASPQPDVPRHVPTGYRGGAASPCRDMPWHVRCNALTASAEGASGSKSRK